ncbi:MAG TPA: NAD-dependent epimerase/dehydratase family protein [Phototrophicaceae bacterium]|jgi:nucleoside-diphosphate-sugar epimerase|nr:NAD-dependent epimerase/dehydratase family protein [Phototrophicaceae bacterium]
MNILIIGGTRHMGHFLTLRLLEAGHRVTLLNRGISRDDLPEDLPRLRADRTDPHQLRRTLAGRSFDIVVDNVLYKGSEAEVMVELMQGKVGHYIFLSTGQVYLVRDGLKRPFHESDYEGVLIPTPEPMSYDHEEWTYGVEKRQAEDVLAAAYRDLHFPYTSLRMPMVNGPRDTFHRLYGYILRIKDGGPILVPETPDYPLRHVYALDVVNAIMRVIELGAQTHGKAYNISQDETMPLSEFLDLLGQIVGVEPHILRVERSLLEANGFLPDCSPFSDRWMSELDNTLSKQELGMKYTPVADYLRQIVQHYQEASLPAPISYRRRSAEKHLVTIEQ